MWIKFAFILFSVCLICCNLVLAYVEAVVGNYVPSSHFQPQVAVSCSGGRQKYRIQYMDESGRWTSDSDTKASVSSTCLRDKLEILEYCRKVYPKRDITNIVEASHYFRIENWCPINSPKKCNRVLMVKPYRCLEGSFQSDALLVPEHCLFDHIHNQSKCVNFDEWNATASKSCQRRATMQLRSFAMLLPCGIGVFSGVEFVCCPRDNGQLIASASTDATNNLAVKMNENDADVSIPRQPEVELSSSDVIRKSAALVATRAEESSIIENIEDDNIDDEDDEDDDDDDDEDEDDDSYEDDDVAAEEVDEKLTKSTTPSVTSTTTVTTTTTTTTTAIPTTTEEVVTSTPDYYFSHFDPRKEHDEFKAAEKRLEDEHREKVTKVMKDWSELEERYQEMKSTDPKGAELFKKKMTARFQKTVSALEDEGSVGKRQIVSLHQQRVMANINEKKRDAMECYTKALNMKPPKAQKVQKCLERLLRALEKDRTHTVGHYKHLLNTNLEQASKEKLLTLDHLNDLSRTLNQSLGMLDHYPEVSHKVKAEIIAFLDDLRSHNEKTPFYLQSKEAENAMLEKYRAEVEAKRAEHQRQKELQKQHHKQMKQEQAEMKIEKKKVEDNLGRKLDQKFDPESMEDETIVSQNIDHGSKVAHVKNHQIHHNEVLYSVKREYIAQHKNSSVYVALSFAGIALLTAAIVGVVFLRRRSSRWPAGQGFVEVDQAATPEERHVANMQVNGYENPTYKYFEVKE